MLTDDERRRQPARAEREHKLAVLAAQQAEDAFAQYGVHLTTDRFNALCDHMAELVTSIMENGQ